MDSKITILIAIVISVIVTAGIMYAVGFEEQPRIIVKTPSPELVYIDKSASEIFNGTNEIKKISSQEELKSILETSALLGGNFYQNRGIISLDSEEWLSGEGGVMKESISESIQVSDSAAFPIMAKSIESGGSEYSTTNVQVKNVDEPDYLKNDSKYVYIVSGNTLLIIDAYPAESAKLILKIALDVESQHIQNMFLNEDRLVIFYNGQSDDEMIPQFDFIPRRSYNPVTHALIVDVSDKEKPIILKDYSIDGHFRDARMIGDYAYFVTNSDINYQNPRLPIILQDTIPLMTPNAFYFDTPEQLTNFNTLTAIDIFGDTINSETFLMGYSGTFYVSEDNFYLTYQQNTPFGFYENSAQNRFFEVIVPLLPNSIQNEIEMIQEDLSMNSTTQWLKISELMQSAYNNMDKDEKQKLFDEIKIALGKYDMKIQEDTRKTIIHKISINEDEIKYIAKGSVPGRLLNQFSMDQSGDRFRIATTVDHYTQYNGTVRSNAVYVLDEQLNTVGELEDIAPDESIFSARFMGDRLYLVTFKQIDPFFVIDLSTDTPKILGELKIPGFSNYLHPFDEEHVIGIGRDTKENENGRVQQLGIKIALFNVADVSNPRVADEVIIGDKSAHSEALNDHKAFFFDKTRGILSIPLSGDSETISQDKNSKIISGGYNYWSGFYVLNLDASDGFSLKGAVSHIDGDTDGNTRYYGSNGARTFYIDDVLYTVSEKYLKMNSFDDLDQINSIKLDNTGKFIKYMEWQYYIKLDYLHLIKL